MFMDEGALKIIKRLKAAGYTAYYAGGWVRDFILGHPSADIDIATDASPETIIKLFPRTVKVGISFGVVVVLINEHQFEVSTFRKDIDYEDGRRPKEVEFTTAEEDAKRRDFTINGMFYDPLEDRVIDYVGGRDDLQEGVVKSIGDAAERIREDRLRMIRAVRFAYRFGYRIDARTEQAIREQAATLFPAVAMERIWQELKKMTAYETIGDALVKMHDLGLLQMIFPPLARLSKSELRLCTASFKHFPVNCPAVLYMIELFPESSLDELIALCRYLKVSNKQLKAVEECDKVRRIPFDAEDASWARVYAFEDIHIYLEVIASRLPDPQRLEFKQTHQERQLYLQPHIDRLILGRPLVNAATLMKEGLKPGKELGKLLSAAESLAINRNLQEADQVLALLKQSPLWP